MPYVPNSQLVAAVAAIQQINDFFHDKFVLDDQDLDPDGDPGLKAHLIIHDCVTATAQESRCTVGRVSTQTPIYGQTDIYLRREWQELYKLVLVDIEDGREWKFKSPSILYNGKPLKNDPRARADCEWYGVNVGVVEVHPVNHGENDEEGTAPLISYYNITYPYEED